MDRVKFMRFDISTKSLIIVNVVMIIVAVALRWSVIDVMWVYWAQSVIIGSIAIFRILLMKQVFAAGFFLVHYGMFHLVYFFFLCYANEEATPAIPIVGIALCSLMFFFNHVFSSWHNWKRDMKIKPEPGSMMLAPYARIIPMHITIIFGSEYATSTGTLALFLVLKTIMDVIMHLVEHRPRRQAEGTNTLQ